MRNSCWVWSASDRHQPRWGIKGNGGLNGTQTHFPYFPMLSLPGWALSTFLIVFAFTIKICTKFNIWYKIYNIYNNIYSANHYYHCTKYKAECSPSNRALSFPFVSSSDAPLSEKYKGSFHQTKVSSTFLTLCDFWSESKGKCSSSLSFSFSSLQQRKNS